MSEYLTGDRLRADGADRHVVWLDFAAGNANAIVIRANRRELERIKMPGDSAPAAVAAARRRRGVGIGVVTGWSRPAPHFISR